MAVVITHNDEEFKRRLLRATDKGLRLAGATYWELCQEAVSIPNTGVSVTRTRNTSRGPKGSSFTIYPTPSAPGEPPKMRTGFGQSNVVLNFIDTAEKRAARVGVAANGFYMFWLEVGTKYIARRPWLVATLLQNRDEIGRLAAIGGKSEIE